MTLLHKHYDSIAKNVEGALPRTLCGLPKEFNIDDESEIDVGQELFLIVNDYNKAFSFSTV